MFFINIYLVGFFILLSLIKAYMDFKPPFLCLITVYMDFNPTP